MALSIETIPPLIPWAKTTLQCCMEAWFSISDTPSPSGSSGKKQSLYSKPYGIPKIWSPPSMGFASWTAPETTKHGRSTPSYTATRRRSTKESGVIKVFWRSPTPVKTKAALLFVQKPTKFTKSTLPRKEWKTSRKIGICSIKMKRKKNHWLIASKSTRKPATSFSSIAAPSTATLSPPRKSFASAPISAWFLKKEYPKRLKH